MGVVPGVQGCEEMSRATITCPRCDRQVSYTIENGSRPVYCQECEEHMYLRYSALGMNPMEVYDALRRPVVVKSKDKQVKLC